MPDLLKLVTALAGVFHLPGPWDWNLIAPLIGLHFQALTAIGKSPSASVTKGGVLADGNLAVDGILLQAPTRQITLLFPDKTIRDPRIGEKRFAVDQRIQVSKAGGGYSIIFTVDDVSCAILVDYPDSVVAGVTVCDAEGAQS
jgi:hypothetical protein